MNKTTLPKNARVLKQKKKYKYDTDSAKKRRKGLQLWKRKMINNQTKQITPGEIYPDEDAKGSSQSRTSAPERGTKTVTK